MQEFEKAFPADEALAGAIRQIDGGTCSCVLLRQGKTLYTGEGRGVKPLIAVLESQPELLRGAVLVDKIIGKAAAMIAVLGGVERVAAVTMSTAAKEYLERRRIPAEARRLVDKITDRTGSGLCPLETSVLSIEDPEAGYRALKETIRRLMAAQN